MKYRLMLVFVVVCAVTCVLSYAQEAPSPAEEHASMSPDRKWEYVGGDQRRIVKAGTNEAALDLSHECVVVGSVIWAPDSKRFAFSCGGGRLSDATLRLMGSQSMRAARPLDQFYQLRDDEWKALKPPNIAVDEILNKAIGAEIKNKRLPKKTGLSTIWQTVEFHQWVDSHTAILYAGVEELVSGGEHLGETFGADFLVTLRFDAQGDWKIVKTHRMSEKEVDKREKGE